MENKLLWIAAGLYLYWKGWGLKMGAGNSSTAPTDLVDQTTLVANDMTILPYPNQELVYGPDAVVTIPENAPSELYPGPIYYALT